MTTYSINIDYNTGHSQFSERVTEEVEMKWENLDQAKKALQHIADHYRQYKAHCEYNSSAFNRAHGFDMESVRSSPWYHGPIDETFPDSWQGTIVLENDKGEKVATSAFWVGFFEKLFMAEVCISISDTESNDMRIFF